ncbi:unnamed protein product [Rhizoctonia solani]|nr:unnamed protein product [Rhizoctonia solani]
MSTNLEAGETSRGRPGHIIRSVRLEGRPAHYEEEHGRLVLIPRATSELLKLGAKDHKRLFEDFSSAHCSMRTACVSFTIGKRIVNVLSFVVRLNSQSTSPFILLLCTVEASRYPEALTRSRDLVGVYD